MYFIVPRKSKLQYCLCEDRIRESVHKYAAAGQLLIREYVTVKTESVWKFEIVFETLVDERWFWSIGFVVRQQF
jgi:hypothetical protein